MLKRLETSLDIVAQSFMVFSDLKRSLTWWEKKNGCVCSTVAVHSPSKARTTVRFCSHAQRIWGYGEIGITMPLQGIVPESYSGISTSVRVGVENFLSPHIFI